LSDPFGLAHMKDDFIAERITQIAGTYRTRLQQLISAHWADRAAAVHAISLYYETQAPHLGQWDLGGGWVMNARSKDLIWALRAVFEVHPPGRPPDVLTFTASDLRYAREVLCLAEAERLFHEHRDMLALGLIEAHFESDSLAFDDPRGVTHGSGMQAFDEANDAYQAARNLPVDTLKARLEELGRIEAREQPEAMLRALEWNLALSSSVPKRKRQEPRSWPLLPDSIARVYEPQKVYGRRMRILADIFWGSLRHNLPSVADDTRLGPATWREIEGVFAFLTALSSHHHDLPRLQEVPPAISRKSEMQIFVPGLPPVLPTRRIPCTVMLDYLVDTSRAALVRVASNVFGIGREPAAAILDACTVRALPPNQTALHNFVFSNLVEIGPERLLLVPTLGFYTADADTVLRLVKTLDPLNYSTLVGEALGKAAFSYAADLRKEPELDVVVDKPLFRPNGQRLTDIDLGVYDRRSNVLALMEFKSFWLQDAETLRSVTENLHGAARQLTRVVDHLTALGPTGIGAMFGVKIDTMPRLCPVIVTRRQYAAGSQTGYPVLPHATLRRLLRESENRMEPFADLAAEFDPSDIVRIGRESWRLFKIDGLSWKAPSVHWSRDIAAALHPPAHTTLALAAGAMALSIPHTGLAQPVSVPQPIATIDAAMIAAIASIFGALLSFLAVIFNEFRRRANDRKIAGFNATLQERLAAIKLENDSELARLSAELKTRNDLMLADFNKAAESQLSAEAARRSYEYEARKRLYHDCEPLLFQLSQTARVAIGRTISLARSARQGELDGTDGLLGGPIEEDSGRGYYFRSTIYQLLAPLCIAYILQSRLTLRDTALDRWINRQFFLSEAAYKALIRDFYFADQPPIVAGYRETADRSSLHDCALGHKKQGVFLGRLDNAIDSLIERNADPAQVITFGRFEQLLLERGSELSRCMAPLVTLFAGFHPRTQPVCWRILVAQYYIFRAIRFDARPHLEQGEEDDTLTKITCDPMSERDLWWKDQADDEVVAPIRIGYAYLTRSLGVHP
jgi:hypothetical protein